MTPRPQAGKYRSAESYIAMYKAECERHGFAWGAVEQRAMRDAVRSCTRGLGGPQRALPISFESLHLLPGAAEPWAPGGPVKPRNLVVLGCWFMVREVEAANAKVKDMQVTKGPDGKPMALWTLPVSETDQQAKGTSRTEMGTRRRCKVLSVWGFRVLTLHLQKEPLSIGSTVAVVERRRHQVALRMRPGTT